MKIDDKSAENISNFTRINKNQTDFVDPELKRERKLKAQAEEMEAIFLTKLIKTMEKTIPKDENSSSASLSSMMFSSEMGKSMAKNGGIGLAKIIYQSLQDRDMDMGEELSKINESLNQDKTQGFNLDSEVFK